MRRVTGILVSVLVLVVASAVDGADSPRFRGPAGDGVYAETGLLKSWPAGGPKLAWSVKGLGVGFSSAVVAGGTVYVTGQDAAGQGQLFAFALDGTPKWKVSYGEEVGKRGPAQPGARGTPTVDGDNVYVVSGFGRLVTVDAKEGKVTGTIDLVKRFGAEVARYGNAESVLVDGDRIICTPGGKDASVVALNKKTGETVWQTKGLGEAPGYCSARVISHGGRRIVTTVLNTSIVGIDAGTGEVLWKHAHPQRNGVQPNPPVYADGMLYATSGGAPGVMLELSADGAGAAQKWSDANLDPSMHGVVLLDGCVYGAGRRALVCLELKTGKVLWSEPKIQRGAVVVAADGMLYVYGSDGTVRLAKPAADSFQPVGSFKVDQGSGMHVAHPTIAEGKLFVRHGDVLLAYDIKAP